MDVFSVFLFEAHMVLNWCLFVFSENINGCVFCFLI